MTIMPKFGSDATKALVIGAASFFGTAQTTTAADREMTQEYSTCLEKSNGVAVEMINCILAETRRQDARLNENYKRLLSKLATERKTRWLKRSGLG